MLTQVFIVTKLEHMLWNKNCQFRGSPVDIFRWTCTNVIRVTFRNLSNNYIYSSRVQITIPDYIFYESVYNIMELH